MSLIPVLGVVGEQVIIQVHFGVKVHYSIWMLILLCFSMQKTKPTQHSVRELRALGLTAHLLACRSAQVGQFRLRDVCRFAWGLAGRAEFSGQKVFAVFHWELVEKLNFDTYYQLFYFSSCMYYCILGNLLKLALTHYLLDEWSCFFWWSHNCISCGYPSFTLISTSEHLESCVSDVWVSVLTILT